MGSNGDKGWAGLGEPLLDKFGYGKKSQKGQGECVYMSAVWKGGAIGEACEQQQEEIRGEGEEKGDEVASTVLDGHTKKKRSQVGERSPYPLNYSVSLVGSVSKVPVSPCCTDNKDVLL